MRYDLRMRRTLKGPATATLAATAAPLYCRSPRRLQEDQELIVDFTNEVETWPLHLQPATTISTYVHDQNNLNNLLYNLHRMLRMMT